MAKYILLDNSDDTILEEADSSRFLKTGKPPTLKPEKGMRWLELVEINPDKGEGQSKEGPVIDITSTTYTRTWTVRDRTAAEIADDKTQQASSKFDIHKSLLLALNDGSFVPGSNYTDEQIKTMLEAKL